MIDTLLPAERLAFVLHDMSDLPFEEIGPRVGPTPQATRQLASRAHRRDQGGRDRSSCGDLARQRAVVNALRCWTGRRLRRPRGAPDPDVVLRADFSPGRPSRSAVFRVSNRLVQARMANRAATVHPALVNGAAGAVVTVRGRPFAVMGFTVAEGKIVEIDAIGDPARVRRIAAAVLASE